MPDGTGLLVLASGRSAGYTRQQIVFVSYPEGKMTPITRDTNSYSDLSVASSGQVLATVVSEEHWNLSVLGATSGGGDARPVGPANASSNFNWTPDGRLIYDRDISLDWVNPDSGAKGVLATEPDSASASPSECPDGRYLLFAHGLHGRNGSVNIWRSDAAGGNLKQLTAGKLDSSPVCSPDERWVYYLDAATTKMLRMPIDGGTPQAVSDLPNSSGGFDLSPDGKLIAFGTLEHSGEHKEMLALVDTGTGSLKCDVHTWCQSKRVEFEHPPFGPVRFARDGKAVVYATRENGVDNLWQQNLDGSPGKQLTSFKAEHINDFHWSFDGKQLALVRGHTDSDVVLMRSQQP
jgi:TolB protein